MVDSSAARPDDEPKSPMWLPALGAALFLGVGLWWAVTPSAPPPVPAGSEPAASAAARPSEPIATAAAPKPVAPPRPTASQALLPRPGSPNPGVDPQRLPTLRNPVVGTQPPSHP